MSATTGPSDTNSSMIGSAENNTSSSTKPISSSTENDPTSANTSSDPTSTSGPTDSSTSGTSGPSSSVAGSTAPVPSTSAPSDPNPSTSLDSKPHDPSTGADPKSGQAPVQKQQGADRPNEEPSDEQTDAIKEKKDNSEDPKSTDHGPGDGLPKDEDIKRDPNDHSGEPMRDHGVDENKEQNEEKKDGQEGGGKLGEDNENKGTGEQWVKTSGVQADGGDFDATKPGAGKEADRLLEEKGIHREGNNTGPPEGIDGKDPLDLANKPSLGSKLKAKLHIGHKDKDHSEKDQKQEVSKS